MFKKITALFLALLMVAGMVACGNTEEKPTEPPVTDPAPTEPEEVATIDPVSYLQISLQEEGQSLKSLMAYPNEDGSAYVELVGEVTKKGNVDGSAIDAITYALEKSGLMELNGAEEYGEGETFASAYVTYGEEGYLSASYYGPIPQAYIDGYKALEACFAELTAEMAEYVPAPQEVGILAESDRMAINEILAGMSIDGIDSFILTNVELEDEGFGYIVGLSSNEGIESALQFTPMMMTTPYSLTIVTLTDGASAEAVAQDFESKIDWAKWICVNPTNAAVAVKDNQVLCLIGGDDLYQQSITAIGAAGWEPVANLENPNL